MGGYTRKSLADYLDSYDAEISALQDSKREMMQDYRGQLVEKGFVKAQIKDEIEALKRAMRRRRAVAKTSETAVDEADALADEIFAEISGPAPRATPARENIEQFPPHDPETGELTDTQEQPEEPASEFHPPVTTREGHEGDPSPTLGEKDLVEAGTGHNCAALPQEPCRAEITPSAAPTAEPEATPSPPPASGSLSNPQPTSSPAVDMAGEPQDGNEPVSGSSATPFNNLRCQKPDTCRWAHSLSACSTCNSAWMKARAA